MPGESIELSDDEDDQVVSQVEEEEDEEEVDEEEDIFGIHKRIFNLLSQIHEGKWLPSGKTPTFAYIGRFKDSVPNPNIKISGLGRVTVPLTMSGVKKITTSPHAEVAPFGHGEITKVDESVRKTRQIDSKHFTFENDEFEAWLSGVVDRVKRELGIVARTVEA